MNNYTDYLQHHGIKGQKWGVRRYRNEDGSLTPSGKRRYKYVVNEHGNMEGDYRDLKSTKQKKQDWNEMDETSFSKKYKESKGDYLESVRKYTDPARYKKDRNYRALIKSEKTTYSGTVAKAVLSAAGTAAVTSAATSILAKRGQLQAAALVKAIGTGFTIGQLQSIPGKIAGKGINDTLNYTMQYKGNKLANKKNETSVTKNRRRKAATKIATGIAGTAAGIYLYKHPELIGQAGRYAYDAASKAANTARKFKRDPLDAKWTYVD